MGDYEEVARREIERQAKGKGKVSFKPVVPGEEQRCPNCWTKLIQHEDSQGHVTLYCFNCYSAAIR